MSDPVPTVPTVTAAAPQKPPVFLTINDLHKSYGDTAVLKGIELTVRRGEVVVVIGPSGSGKSTLLSCINFLEPFDRGEVLLDGEPIGFQPVKGSLRVAMKEKALNLMRQKIGIVFQQYNLFPHMTVLQNVIEAPVQVKKTPRAEAEALGREQLAKVGLANKADAYPAQLSGGQQQRVAIARALAMKPKLMLFDEVTSALDPELVGEVLAAIRTLADEGMTMVVVTHEMAFARDVGDVIVFMDAGQVVETGPPATFFTNPRHERTRTFLHRILRDDAAAASRETAP